MTAPGPNSQVRNKAPDEDMKLLNFPGSVSVSMVIRLIGDFNTAENDWVSQLAMEHTFENQMW